jgi:AraC-like DNA-binding protein
MTLETLDSAINIATVGICLFCANLLLLRRRDPGIYMPLAMFFLFQGIASVLVFFAFGGEEVEASALITKVAIVSTVLEIASPFLFWLYVQALTTEGEMLNVPRLRFHIIPIVLTTACFWTLLFLPSGFAASNIQDDDPRLLVILVISVAVLIGGILVKVMIGTYLYLIARRLMAYQKRLKEVFASTESRELNWIWVIIISTGIYLLLITAFRVAIWVGLMTEDGLGQSKIIIESFTQLVLFWIIGMWGLRQRPGLMREPMVEASVPEDAPARKYEKSALDSERATRIAKKIEAAMEKDLLYRDPNLSLWDLAKHISVTSHYVSQTLNSHLSSSFFDLVNGWRIKDAIIQLTTTDETILFIAYDVGFNSRSAFYKAFKRETGKTPSDLRK